MTFIPVYKGDIDMTFIPVYKGDIDMTFIYVYLKILIWPLSMSI